MRICLCSIILIFAIPCSSWAEAIAGLQRIAQLDSLASDIAGAGFIPSGGMLPVLAASNGWFGLLSGVRLLPGNSGELDAILSDTTDDFRYYGASMWSAAGDIILVTAPPPLCLPHDISSSVDAGDEVVFSIDGYEYLNNPRTAVGTPEMEVIEILPDSAGIFRFTAFAVGVYWVEVLSITESGPSISLLFPVISGGTAADLFNGTLELTCSEASSPSEILDELNSIRISRGIPALESSETLDSLASLRASDLAYSGTSSHFGSYTSLAAMLPAGVTVYGENIGRGKSYQEAWSMILISPFHFGTCIRESYTHAGLSGSIDSSEYEWQLVLVQVFAAGEDVE